MLTRRAKAYSSFGSARGRILPFSIDLACRR